MSGAMELLPCPWCSHENIEPGEYGGRDYLWCAFCQASGPMDDPDGTLWNTRAPDPAVAALEAEVARLRAQYEDEHQARLSLQSLAADECEVAITLRGLLSEACWYVSDALEAYEHTDGRDLLNRIDAALNPGPSEKEAG